MPSIFSTFDHIKNIYINSSFILFVVTMLNPKAVGISLAIVWGVSVFLMGLISGTGYGLGFVNALGTMYIYYQPGIIGAIIGLIYGLIDGFIGGFVFAYLYNMFEKK